MFRFVVLPCFDLCTVHVGLKVSIQPRPSTDPRTLFYPRYNRATGTLAFQSVCFPDKFLIFHNKTLLKLGTPTGGNEQFVERQLYYGRVFRSYVFNKPECFMAFDHVGNVHTDQLCKVMLNQSDFLVHRLVGRLTDPCRPRSTTEL